jgi:hypothetical protein
MATAAEILPAYLSSGAAAFAHIVAKWPHELAHLNDDEWRSAYRARAAKFVARAKRVAADGGAFMYRAVSLPVDKPWMDSIRFDRIGASWSFVRSGANTYYGPAYDAETSDVIIRAYVPYSSFYWEASLLNFLIFGESEWEGRLVANAPVSVVSVDGKRLREPISASVGPVGDRWRHT